MTDEQRYAVVCLVAKRQNCAPEDIHLAAVMDSRAFGAWFVGYRLPQDATGVTSRARSMTVWRNEIEADDERA